MSPKKEHCNFFLQDIYETTAMHVASCKLNLLQVQAAAQEVNNMVFWNNTVSGLNHYLHKAEVLHDNQH
jgi:hypothetical protein